MTKWPGRARRSLGLATCLVAAALGAGCGGSKRSAVEAPEAMPTTAPPASDRDALVAQLQRERDDAEHRARDAQRAANEAQSQCQLTQHELESLRERDSFEEAIWSRLGHAEISEDALRERAVGAARARRLSLEGTLKDAAAAHASIEQALRRVHLVPDIEWARYKHDVESTLDGLDRLLRDSP